MTCVEDASFQRYLACPKPQVGLGVPPLRNKLFLEDISLTKAGDTLS